MSFYAFEYNLPKGYFLRILPYYEETDLTRAFLYRGRRYGQTLIDVRDYPNDTPKLKIVEEAVDFIEELESRVNSEVEVN